MGAKLLTKHLLQVLSLKGGCTGSSEPTLVKMSHCWKSHATAHLILMMADEKSQEESAKSELYESNLLEKMIYPLVIKCFQ